MIFKVADLLGYVRDRFPCMPGDLLLTGTPEGVSAMQAGDKVEAQVLGPQGQLLSQGSWQVMRR
ncbi:FAA_hydrolase domain-containing protein [Haematococcus lacustris]|uniref:FAA_hydrolase domain-containing protein n=1 Tax=Haematococcus lacustris TaxID=44745 RepID=A0A6A0A0K6_HAELA|nr:FAA_hydrolase domain-containing protein [Haematococcus lacustris]